MTDENIVWIRRALSCYLSMLHHFDEIEGYVGNGNEFFNAVTELATELNVDLEELIDW